MTVSVSPLKSQFPFSYWKLWFDMHHMLSTETNWLSTQCIHPLTHLIVTMNINQLWVHSYTDASKHHTHVKNKIISQVPIACLGQTSNQIMLYMGISWSHMVLFGMAQNGSKAIMQIKWVNVYETRKEETNYLHRLTNECMVSCLEWTELKYIQMGVYG